MDGSPPVSIPRLRSARLTLREYRPSDFSAFADVVMGMGGYDRRDAWRAFGCNTGGWLLDGAGWWAVDTNDTHETVGFVGAFLREGACELELGWNVLSAFRGRGYASEAGAEVARWAFEVRGEERIIALIRPDNAASRKVAERIGFRYERDTELWGRSLGKFALSAPSPRTAVRVPSTLTLFARFHAQTGAEGPLDTLLREQVAVTRREPGCVGIELHRSMTDPRLSFIHSRWTSEAAFDVHAGLPRTRDFVERVQALIDHPFEVTRARPVG
jgi:RimJ/RimL family protein N-acetyltransferase/quinol monooxygenase YgiN